jgi:hypothetical protein
MSALRADPNYPIEAASATKLIRINMAQGVQSGRPPRPRRGDGDHADLSIRDGIARRL